MHDALRRSYEPDTVVVDVEDPSPRARVQAEELTMHVMHGGLWHRRMPDLSATSCDERYHSQFAPLRREELTEPLCRVCFTPAEIERAARAAEDDDDDR
jgi:hypothetical protein